MTRTDEDEMRCPGLGEYHPATFVENLLLSDVHSKPVDRAKEVGEEN